MSKDVFWSYCSYFLNFSVNLIVLPVILKYLTDKELGLWYVFVSVGTMIQLLDIGISPVMQHNITYVWNGVSRICREGVDSTPDADRYYRPRLMKKVLNVSNVIYLVLSVISLLLLMSAGTFYIISVAVKSALPSRVYLWAWIVYAVGLAFSFYWNRWTNYLGALGKVAAAQKTLIAVKILYILLTFIGLFFHGGLLAVALATILSSFLPRLLVERYFLKLCFGTESSHCRFSMRQFCYFWRIIWFNAKRFGAVSVAGLLASQSTMLICSYFCGLEICGQYGLSLQLMTVSASVGAVMFHAYFPRFCAAFAQKDFEQLRKNFSLTFVTAWGIMIAGMTVTILLAEKLLFLFHIDKHLLSTLPLCLLALYTMLDRNLQLNCGFITAGNRVPFARATLIASIVSVALSVATILLIRNDSNVVILIVIPLIVQSCYNFWRWPMEVCRELSMSPYSLICSGNKQILQKIAAFFPRFSN